MKRFLFLILAALLLVGPVVTTAQAIFVNSDIQSPTLIRRVSSSLDVINTQITALIPTARNEGFFNGTSVGGGIWTWDATKNKNLANGGTITDPDNTGGYDGTPSTLAAFLTAQGGGVGFGCWVRQYDGAVSALWFGADATGIEDSTLAIRATIFEVNRIGGGVAYLPSGSYLYSSDMDLMSNVTLQGDGYGTFLFTNSVDVRSLQNENRTGPSITDENISIFDLRIDLNGSGSTSEFSHCIDMRFVRNLNIQRVWVTNASGDGIYNNGNDSVVIRDIVVEDVGRQGVTVVAGNNYVIENIFGHGFNAFTLVDIEPNPGDFVDNVRVENVHVRSGTGNGISVAADSVGFLSNVTIKNITTFKLFLGRVTNCWVEDITVTATDASAIAVEMPSNTNLTIKNINILDSGEDFTKMKISSSFNVDAENLVIVGPDGNTNIGLEVLQTEGFRGRNITITKGGIFGAWLRLSSDISIDGLSVDGSGTYGANLADNTGDVKIKGFAVTTYATGLRVEGAGEIVDVEGDLTNVASPVSISLFTGKLQIDKLLGYTSRQFVGVMVPTTGDWLRGDMMWHRQPSAGGNLGWVNIASGTPGTWVPFGGIESANAYTVINPVSDRTFDVTATTVDEVARILGNLIIDLQGSGILK